MRSSCFFIHFIICNFYTYDGDACDIDICWCLYEYVMYPIHLYKCICPVECPIYTYTCKNANALHHCLAVPFINPEYHGLQYQLTCRTQCRLYILPLKMERYPQLTFNYKHISMQWSRRTRRRREEKECKKLQCKYYE